MYLHAAGAHQVAQGRVDVPETRPPNDYTGDGK